MTQLVIDGVKPWDGRYEFATPDLWTTREWGFVKRLSGYLPLTIEDGFKGGDPELFAVMAVIMLQRAGKISAAEVPELFTDRFADVPFGATIRIETDDDEQEETDAGPPAGSADSSSNGSGDSSKTSSESSEPDPSSSGTPASATSESPRIRSVI
jgi:hypothetical protein